MLSKTIANSIERRPNATPWNIRDPGDSADRIALQTETEYLGVGRLKVRDDVLDQIGDQDHVFRRRRGGKNGEPVSILFTCGVAFLRNLLLNGLFDLGPRDRDEQTPKRVFGFDFPAFAVDPAKERPHRGLNDVFGVQPRGEALMQLAFYE